MQHPIVLTTSNWESSFMISVTQIKIYKPVLHKRRCQPICTSVSRLHMKDLHQFINNPVRDLNKFRENRNIYSLCLCQKYFIFIERSIFSWKMVARFLPEIRSENRFWKLENNNRSLLRHSPKPWHQSDFISHIFYICSFLFPNLSCLLMLCLLLLELMQENACLMLLIAFLNQGCNVFQ